jgi:hypothetical protein
MMQQQLWSTPFAYNNHSGAPRLSFVNPNIPSFASFGVATQLPPHRGLMEIFGFTPFGIHCRLCQASVGSTQNTIKRHTMSKEHGLFSWDEVNAFKTMADKEVERLSRDGNIDS